MAKLDTQKPYGTICGDHEARFEQDGKYFDAHGDEVKPGEPAKPAKPSKDKAAAGPGTSDQPPEPK